MQTIQALQTLEEDMLYLLYENHLLKKSIVRVESLSVFFEQEAPAFSLILVTDKEQRLILQKGNEQGFIRTLQTYKRLETDMEDWDFLDRLLEELEESLPSLMKGLSEKFQGYYKHRFKTMYQLPIQSTARFETGEETFSYEVLPLHERWTKAWNRFVSLKESYFKYLGFKGDSLQNLLEMKIMHMSENEITHDTYGNIIEFRLKVMYEGEYHTFHFYQNKAFSNSFITHMYVDAYLDKEADTLTPIGKLLADFFSIERDNGFDFEKQVIEFLHHDEWFYESSLMSFSLHNEATTKIGQTITKEYKENGKTIFVLNDGTKLIEK